MQASLCPVKGKASFMLRSQRLQQRSSPEAVAAPRTLLVARQGRAGLRRAQRSVRVRSSASSVEPRSSSTSDYGRYWTQDENEALVNYARRTFSTSEAVLETHQRPAVTFFDKVKRAWQIFFPPQPKALNPREEGKNRLRMILVADRCGLSPMCLTEMKESIMEAVSEYVEIDSDDEVEISMTSDEDAGLIYSVAVPVRRVKPDKRAALLAAEAAANPDGGGFDREHEWDEDPAARFPYGT